MEASLVQSIQDFSIGAIAVLALAYISLKHSQTQKESQDAFIKTLDDRADKHESAMQEREDALRKVEFDVRTGMTEQLSKNTVAMSEVTKVLSRVVHHLDGGKH